VSEKQDVIVGQYKGREKSSPKLRGWGENTKKDRITVEARTLAVMVRRKMQVEMSRQLTPSDLSAKGTWGGAPL